MSLRFYSDKEDIIKNDDSINNYKEIFEEYKKKIPTLDEALNEMYSSAANLSDSKVKALKDDILAKSAEIIQNNFEIIKKKYPLITKEDAQIISSYNCIPYDPNFSPYKILNNNLCEENRYEGLKRISKYFYIFLKALRKLNRYYTKKEYLYKCIYKRVNLQDDYNKNRIIFKRGTIKIFLGFTSFSSFTKKSYFEGEKEKIIEKGTIFAIYGDIYGYDISLFNYLMNEEIIIEPEQKFVVVNAVPPNKNSKFINIRLRSENYNILLPNIINYEKIYYKFDDSKLIKIIYKFPYKHSKSYKPYYIRIFGDKFVENNQKYCKYIFENKEYTLNVFFDIKDIIGDRIEIYLNGFDRVSNLCQMFENCENFYSSNNLFITSYIVNMKEMFKGCSSFLINNIEDWDTSNVYDMSYMFYECSKITLLPNLSKWNTSNVEDINNMFSKCSYISNLPDISRWNTSKIKNMSYLFYECHNLKFLPDISKWDLSNVTDIKYMFYRCFKLSNLPEISLWNLSSVNNMMYLFASCISLSTLPNISKWDISNVKNMNSLFYECSNLKSLPDISNWNLSNTQTISKIFDRCRKLKALPDISKWDISKIYYIDYAFANCSSLLYLPNISKWKITRVSNMNSLFQNCSSLTFLPDISKWNTFNVNEMKSVFEGCISLISLPDISKWDISNVSYINFMFKNCKLLITLPDISKWKTSNIVQMDNMFEGCFSLVTIPDISKWDTTNVLSINYMFTNCISLSYIPIISKWKNFETINNKTIDIDSINCIFIGRKL